LRLRIAVSQNFPKKASLCPSSELLRQGAVEIKRGSGASVW
jgi:hypothetical protein